MASVHKRRGAMAEINVVPYIDVMLVLLVIFMVTTPLLTQSVKVDLPKAEAQPLPEQNKAVIISIKNDSTLWVEMFNEKDSVQQIGQVNKEDIEKLALEVKNLRGDNPAMPVLLRGDKVVPYGVVIRVLAALRKDADLQDVGLMTEPGDEQ